MEGNDPVQFLQAPLHPSYDLEREFAVGIGTQLRADCVLFRSVARLLLVR